MHIVVYPYQKVLTPKVHIGGSTRLPKCNLLAQRCVASNIYWYFLLLQIILPHHFPPELAKCYLFKSCWYYVSYGLNHQFAKYAVNLLSSDLEIDAENQMEGSTQIISEIKLENYSFSHKSVHLLGERLTCFLKVIYNVYIALQMLLLLSFPGQSLRS